MGACASRFKALKDSGDVPPPPVTKEETAAADAVVEEEVKEKDEGLVSAADDEAKHQSLGQMLVQENEGDKGSAKNDRKESGELKQEDAEPPAGETEKTDEKSIQISNLETFENVQDKHVAELVKAVEFEGNEESETDKKPEAKKIEDKE